MNIFLDIGSTLLGGPRLSPPKQITSILGLDGAYLEKIRNILFGENHRTKRSLIKSIELFLHRKLSSDEKNKIHDVWRSQYDDTYLIDGAYELLKFIDRCDYFTPHIISNLWFPFYKKFNETMKKININFQTETLSFVEGVIKPSERLFSIAFKNANTIPEHSIFIGDSMKNDIIPCMKLGVSACIWVNPDEDRLQHEFEHSGELYSISSLYQAMDVLIKIKEKKIWI